MRWTHIAILVLLFVLVGLLVAWCYPMFAYGPLSPQAANVLAGPLPFGLVAVIGALAVVIRIETQGRGGSTTHGSARLATRSEQRAFAVVPGQQPQGLFGQLATLLNHRAGGVMQLPSGSQQLQTPESALVLGRYNGQAVALNEKQQEEHLLLLAQTGGGKSSLVIIPALLRELGSRSLYIADMKDELYRVTAGALAEHHEIWLFAPFRPQESNGYNPLAHVQSVSDAQDLAMCWIKNTGEEGAGDFWSKSSRMLMTAVVLHLRAAEPHCPFARLADVLTATKFDVLQAMLEASPSEDATRAIGAFLTSVGNNDRLMGSVMADISNRFQVLALREIRSSTAVNELDFERMTEEHIALFLSLDPDEADRLRPLIACMTMQMFACWRRKAKASPNGALPHGVVCYLDEFANIGYIPKYASYISTARSMRIALLMACQSFAQLEALYGKQDATTIRSNSITQLLLPGAGLEECKYFSERIGDTTIVAHSRSSRAGSDATSSSESEVRRRLYTPDELRTMPERSLLMVRGRVPAILMQATPYYEDRSLANRANLPIQQPRRQTARISHEALTIPVIPLAPQGSGGTSRPRLVIEAEDDDTKFIQPE